MKAKLVYLLNLATMLFAGKPAWEWIWPQG